MGALGLEVPSAEIDTLFSEWDRDGGGSLDFTELKKILSQSAPPTPLQQAGNAVKNGQAFIKVSSRGLAQRPRCPKHDGGAGQVLGKKEVGGGVDGL